MPKAPPFTAETAAAAGRLGGKRSAEAKAKAREERRLLILQARIQATASGDDSRRTRTLSQIDLLDNAIDDALERGLHERALELVGAKDRLWKLVQPTAGSLRPGRSRREAPPSITAPVPISAPVAQPAPVAPEVPPASTNPGGF